MVQGCPAGAARYGVRTFGREACLSVANPNPHDALFRGLLEAPERAAALIRDHLPAEIAALLSPDPPALIDGTFIDEALKESRSDRLFSISLADGKPALLYILLEHKSWPDPETPLQLLGYMAAIWKRWLKKKEASPARLPPILPIVFYHGGRKWTVPLSIRDCIDTTDALRPWIDGFGYVLRDLGPIPYEALSRDRAVRAALGALKYAFRSGVGAAILETLIADLPDGDSLEVQILTYIVHVYDTTVRDLGAAVERVKPERRDDIMPTVAQEWVRQGRAEGRVEGRIEGKAEMLQRQLRRRFGVLPPEVEARLQAAGGDQLDAWSDRFVDARTLDEVFTDQAPH